MPGVWNRSSFGDSFPSEISLLIFVPRSGGLIIELDGGQHGEPEAIAKDNRRTLALEAWGYRVIRFWDNKVLQNLDGVVEAILEALRGTSP